MAEINIGSVGRIFRILTDRPPSVKFFQVFGVAGEGIFVRAGIEGAHSYLGYVHRRNLPIVVGMIRDLRIYHHPEFESSSTEMTGKVTEIMDITDDLENYPECFVFQIDRGAIGRVVTIECCGQNHFVKVTADHDYSCMNQKGGVVVDLQMADGRIMQDRLLNDRELPVRVGSTELKFYYDFQLLRTWNQLCPGTGEITRVVDITDCLPDYPACRFDAGPIEITVVVEGVGEFVRQAPRNRTTLAGFAQDVGYPLSELVWSDGHIMLLNGRPTSLSVLLKNGDRITILRKNSEITTLEQVNDSLRRLGYT